MYLLREGLIALQSLVLVVPDPNELVRSRGDYEGLPHADVHPVNRALVEGLGELLELGLLLLVLH